jgi:hypothetical protein
MTLSCDLLPQFKHKLAETSFPGLCKDTMHQSEERQTPVRSEGPSYSGSLSECYKVNNIDQFARLQSGLIESTTTQYFATRSGGD